MSEVMIVRNVNEALYKLRELVSNNPVEGFWRNVAPRGLPTYEYTGGPFITEYTHPEERVLFSPARDANPFFHFFEALWIMAGRRDVEFLQQFNPRMADFSDDGVSFHAAYGDRLRRHFWNREEGLPLDQLVMAADMLRVDHATRQVVLCIWDPLADLNQKTKDMPCNAMVFVKVRDEALQMTVCCRSNDAVWGAYGANAVQFSFIQEWLAIAVGVQIGRLRQISDSFHVYTSNEAWARVMAAINENDYTHNYYAEQGKVSTYPIMQAGTGYRRWLDQCAHVISRPTVALSKPDPFFTEVVMPIWNAWNRYKLNTLPGERAHLDNVLQAQEILKFDCHATDWGVACIEWLGRRKAIQQ